MTVSQDNLTSVERLTELEATVADLELAIRDYSGLVTKAEDQLLVLDQATLREGQIFMAAFKHALAEGSI